MPALPPGEAPSFSRLTATSPSSETAWKKQEKSCVFVSRLGLDGEAIQTGLAGIEKPNYLSLILAPAEEKNK